MGSKKKMVAVLAMIPLLLMMAGGMALSHWDDEVKVTGSVSMGTFNVQMSLEDTWDNEGSLDVGSISANLETWDDGDDSLDGGVNDLLSIEISNVYPGYVACVEFNVENAGTIPAFTNTSLISVNFATSFDWDTYDEYFMANMSYFDGSDYILIAHLDDSGTLIYDYDFSTDPLGILTLDAGETEYFIGCFGLEAEPVNAPEDLMDQTMSLTIVIEWLQAVP